MGAAEVMAQAVEPALRKLAGHKVQRLLGFWFMVHAAGGFKHLIDQRWISDAGAYVQRKEFAAAFGVDVEDFLPHLAAQIRPSGVEPLERRQIVKRPS